MGKILIVEDNDNIRLMLKTMLIRDKHIVLESCNGEQAIQALVLNSDIDVVLLDIMMPIMDGKSFLLYIKKIPCRSFKICMLTAKNLKDDIKECLKNGADDYLIKPIDKQLLQEKIHQLLTGTSNGNFSSVQTLSDGFLLKPSGNIKVSITSFSEFDIQFLSPIELPLNAKIMLSSKIMKQVLKLDDNVLIRTYSCEREGREFKTKASFIGLTENLSQKLRSVATTCEEIYEQ